MTRRELRLLAEIVGDHDAEKEQRRQALLLRSRTRANRWAARRHADRIGATT